MSRGPSATDIKLLPGTEGPGPTTSVTTPPAVAAPPATVVPAAAPPRQMSELPRDELDHVAEEFGLAPTQYKTRQALVAAIHDRRQMIAALDRDAMLDVIRWGRRPVTQNASRE